MASLPTREAAKFYLQDIVRQTTSPHTYGVVLRCWHDAEDVQLPPTTDPLMRPLVPGEVGVSFLVGGFERQIVSESELCLVDRVLQPGDLCKRSIDDVRSGVVTRARVKARLEHVISGAKVPGMWTSEHVSLKRDADIGDYVVYDDWLGQVMETFDESLIELSTGQLIRLPELGTRFMVGEKVKDIVPDGGKGLTGITLHRNPSDTGLDTVLNVKHTAYAIAWLALNQCLDPTTLETKQRPQRFWSGSDITQLTIVRGRFELELHVGDRVHFKSNPPDLPVTHHGKSTDFKGIIPVKSFLVAETETLIDVLWQDGTQDTMPATDLIPYVNPDEYDCWPGDHVLWKCENQTRPAVVQLVNSEDRTARVIFHESSEVELVPLLELDPRGTAELQVGLNSLGLHRGNFVFVHKHGSTNGFDKPMVPRIGEVEAWLRGPQWKAELANLGEKLARSSDGKDEYYMAQPTPNSGQFNWIGEVTALNLDGTIEVTHPDGSVGVFPLERLTKLYDGIEQMDDNSWDGDASDADSNAGDEVWQLTPDGLWEPVSDQNEHNWMDEDGDEFDRDKEENMDIDQNSWSHEDSSGASPKLGTRPSATPSSESPSEPDQAPSTSCDPSSMRTAALSQGSNNQRSWTPFSILSSAPLDHAFVTTTPTTASRSFLTRLHKEYRVLANSLPESIIVRAFEDRADLLRSLIIGPENTPYADAPFVIDWMLNADFPQTPPVAHFWSWTNGNGRVNPNLYEEGKVCLSILGTWVGDKNEVWSATRSSLLQALVSIQGLVLVKEPWFCEPAYDKLRGSEAGTVNSRLYSEKAYVLSRGFVRRALELPLGGLENEIRTLYYDNGLLKKVIQDAEALVEKSKNTPRLPSPTPGAGPSKTTREEELAIPRLTAGGIITLERTLKVLRDLLRRNGRS